MKHIQLFESFFRFGKKSEKEKEIEKANSEINKYSFHRLFFEPALNKINDKEAIEKLVKIRLTDAKNSMPTVAKLLPHLFEINKNGNGSILAMTDHNGKRLKGRIPSDFNFLVDKNDYNLIHDEKKCKDEMRSKINKK
jgi:hypothetical protein